jgi:hypothetical protein
MLARPLVFEEFNLVAAHVATIIAAFHLKHRDYSFKRKTFILEDVVASWALATWQVSSAACACNVRVPILAKALLNTRKLT